MEQGTQGHVPTDATEAIKIGEFHCAFAFPLDDTSCCGSSASNGVHLRTHGEKQIPRCARDDTVVKPCREGVGGSQWPSHDPSTTARKRRGPPVPPAAGRRDDKNDGALLRTTPCRDGVEQCSSPIRHGQRRRRRPRP